MKGMEKAVLIESIKELIYTVRGFQVHQRPGQ